MTSISAGEYRQVLREIDKTAGAFSAGADDPLTEIAISFDAAQKILALMAHVLIDIAEQKGAKE